MFKSLKALFYAAGSVQGFARPFLEAGVKVVSAWGANAIPVCEYTVAQILMANKGVLRAAKTAGSRDGWKKYKAHNGMPGNFETEVALLGAGMIGRGVIKLLKPYMLNVLVFDPFLSEAGASALGVEKVELAEAFMRGMVVSNHIANLPETKGILKGELFASMRPNATFINTGRGATVDEPAMIQVLQQRPDLTAVLDVTHPEPPDEGSQLYSMENVILTPHIAGSAGNEVRRMADFMIEEATALRDGKPLKYEVTLGMLDTMA
jgi:phosphoglycerate dehydrogenase-like enzyme